MTTCNPRAIPRAIPVQSPCNWGVAHTPITPKGLHPFVGDAPFDTWRHIAAVAADVVCDLVPMPRSARGGAFGGVGVPFSLTKKNGGRA